MKKVLALIGLLVVCALLSAASDPFAYPVKTVILDAERWSRSGNILCMVLCRRNGLMRTLH